MVRPKSAARPPDAPRRVGGVDAVTVTSARRHWATEFRAHNIESPELDARLLVGHALGLDHAALAAAGARTLDSKEISALAALAHRRLLHEPIARILGRREFWSLSLGIDATTLVPRPESEIIVEAALAAIDARRARERPLRILDLGTGCGALLLALLSELPNAFGIGTDISIAALRMAHENARRHQLWRAGFVACDLAASCGGTFDIIVSNPPYIATADIANLAPEVRDFDPRQALDGGPDGLDFYRVIAASVPALLADDGVLIVELGAGQSNRVAAMFNVAGLAPPALRPDLNGVPRALIVENRA
jgi:release factor glutamine methyltransferase